MRNVKRLPCQNEIKKMSDFAKTYIEITLKLLAKLQKKNLGFSFFATRVTADLAQGGRES